MAAETLYDHYKDSNEQQKGFIAKRDRLTIALLLTTVLFAFLLSSPQSITQCANQFLSDSYGIKNEIFNFSMLHTGVIYLLLWFVLQYYQICLTIEKWYGYIWVLEEKLIKNGEIISREGISYAASYPLLKNVANFLYAWGIPIVVGTIASLRASIVLKVKEGNFILDFLGLTLISILSMLYFSDRNLNWKSWKQYSNFCKKIRAFVKLDVKESNNQRK